EASGVIVVYVGIADPLYVLNTETELTNVSDNLRGGMQGAVDQHVPFGGRDQNTRDPVSTHVIRVAEYSERLLRRVPFGALRAGGIGLGARDGRRNHTRKQGGESQMRNCVRNW